MTLKEGENLSPVWNTAKWWGVIIRFYPKEQHNLMILINFLFSVMAEWKVLNLDTLARLVLNLIPSQEMDLFFFVCFEARSACTCIYMESEPCDAVTVWAEGALPTSAINSIHSARSFAESDLEKLKEQTPMEKFCVEKNGHSSKNLRPNCVNLNEKVTIPESFSFQIEKIIICEENYLNSNKESLDKQNISPTSLPPSL